MSGDQGMFRLYIWAPLAFWVIFSSPYSVLSAQGVEPEKASNGSISEKPAASIPRRNPNQGRIEGTVQVAGTTEPVPGAVICCVYPAFNLVGSIDADSVTTADDGKFSLTVPRGISVSFHVVLPPGYLSRDGKIVMEEIRIQTPERLLVQNVLVDRGAIWKLQMENSTPQPADRLFYCHVYTKSDQRNVASKFDEKGIAQFTPPVTEGEFQLLFVDETRFLGTVTVPKVEFSRGFDPNRIVGIRLDENTKVWEVTDGEGRNAKITGARAINQDGTLVISVAAPDFSQQPTLQVNGLVVDESRQPLAGAEVTLKCLSEIIRAEETRNSTTTDAAGRFHFERVRLSGLGEVKLHLQAMVRHTGKPIATSVIIEVPENHSPSIDFGTISTSPGQTGRVRVVDCFGAPVPGVSIAISDNQGHLFDVESTNEHGELNSNLFPTGECTLICHHQGWVGIKTAAFPRPAGSLSPIVLQLIRSMESLDDLTPDPVEGVPQFEDSAPELEIAEWTDEKPRTLADLKGSVVVLYFWDKDEEGCKEQIALLDKLQQKYAGRAVVFLGVHKAGAKADAVREFMKTQDWTLPTGIDLGLKKEESETYRKYDADPFQSAVVTRDGKISFSEAGLSDAATAGIMYLAGDELGIDLDAAGNSEDTEMDGCEVCVRIHEYILGKAIDAALAK